MIQFVAFLVGMGTLWCVMEPVHARDVVTAETIVDAWHARLPLVAAAGAITGVAAGWFTPLGGIRLGITLAWPSAFYAAFAWALYYWLRQLASVDPVEPAMIAELETRGAQFLTLITAFPSVLLVTGCLGVIAGRALRGSVPRPETLPKLTSGLTVAPAAQYGEAWSDYRKRLTITTRVLVGWVIANLLGWLFPPVSRIIFFLTTAAAIVALTWHQSFRCPRCGNRFFSKYRGQGNVFTRTCRHCGLPKWSAQ